jgi:Tfp pilus assembly protein FimT
MRHLRAFTLIEAILVIIIIGILTVVSLPNISVFNVLKFSGAGKKILADIRYAQSTALNRHNYTALQFIAASETYSGSFCNAANQANCFPITSANWAFLADPLTRVNMAMDFRTDSQYRGININSTFFGGADILVFDTNGMPRNATGAELSTNGVLVVGHKGETITFQVVPKTGKVYFDQSF